MVKIQSEKLKAYSCSMKQWNLYQIYTQPEEVKEKEFFSVLFVLFHEFCCYLLLLQTYCDSKWENKCVLVNKKNLKNTNENFDVYSFRLKTELILSSNFVNARHFEVIQYNWLDKWLKEADHRSLKLWTFKFHSVHKLFIIKFIQKQYHKIHIVL